MRSQCRAIAEALEHPPECHVDRDGLSRLAQQITLTDVVPRVGPSLPHVSRMLKHPLKVAFPEQALCLAALLHSACGKACAVN